MTFKITGFKLGKQSFQNDFRRLPADVKAEAGKRLGLLLENMQAGKLRFHALNDYHPTIYTIDITSGRGPRYKASFQIEGSVAVFLRCGTHKEIDRCAE